jgi:hypothetical protein
VEPRSLDRFVLDQDTSLWIVLAAGVALILGLIFRAALAEQKRQRKEGERKEPE